MEVDNLKDLQQEELQILVDFQLYCQQNDLKYFLIGGALLGATRNKSFIPWDDDIDVAMFRNDYERLQSCWKLNPLQSYFLQSSETDPLYAREILKLRKKGTHIIETECQHLSINDGIYIDIFPIDYVNEGCTKTIKRRAKLIRYLMTCRTIKSGYKGNKYMWLKRIIKLLLTPLPSIIIDKCIYKLCTKENTLDKNYAVLYLHNYPVERQIHSVDIFGVGRPCCLEGFQFIAPQNTNAFLTKVFGNNYMQIPPKDKQKMPHNYKNIVFSKKNN